MGRIRGTIGVVVSDRGYGRVSSKTRHRIEVAVMLFFGLLILGPFIAPLLRAIADFLD